MREDPPSKSANSPATAEYRSLISQFYLNYVLLVQSSFELQNALKRSPMDMGHFLARRHSCASSCATLVRDQLGPTGLLEYSPDSHFVQTSYAVLTLLKLICPEFSAYLDNEQSTITLIKDVADVLEYNSVNSTHAPALDSTFLEALIPARLEQPSEENWLLRRAERRNSLRWPSEMGPVADVSTFLPTMVPDPMEDPASGMTMDSVFSSNFWDNVLVPELLRRDYTANGGSETFFSYAGPEKDILVGLLRLRKCLEEATLRRNKCARRATREVVRELHVYCTAVPVYGRDPTNFQHQSSVHEASVDVALYSWLVASFHQEKVFHLKVTSS
ncbi:hypothetical protein C8R42DRAFT_730096 [Lentinula raphanica]|nr:hypothetical protein C8R42DRAFT_730096 [Lentinula raphanica]